MSAGDPMVPVKLRLPKRIYDEAAQAAADEGREVADELGVLVAEGLESRATAREILERVSAQYRARLASEGKLQHSPEEVLEELRDVREQIARELYP